MSPKKLLFPSLCAAIAAAVYLGCHAVAQASGSALPATVSEGVDWTAVLAIAGAVLGAIATVLHVIAPRTKTTIDDRVVDVLDALLTHMRAPPAPVVESKPAVSIVPPPGAGTAAMLALLVAALSSQVSCGGGKQIATAAGHAIVECAKQDLAAELGVVLKLASDAVGKKLDWNQLLIDVEPLGLVGHCAFVEFYAALHAPSTPAPAPAELTVAARTMPDPGLVALERLRSRNGGVRWRLASGRVL